MTSLLTQQFKLADFLATKQTAHLLRSCQVVHKKDARLITIADREYLNFASNDYLGLSADPRICVALTEGIQLYGAGTGASALVTGYTTAHHELCTKLASLTHHEAVLLFSSGFAANQTLIKAFAKLNADLVLDKLCHASMQDALTHSVHFMRFNHQDFNHLQKRLASSTNPVVFSEGVFSMDGDITNLPALKDTLHNIPFVLDDAHGFGVLGKQGLGTCEHFALPHTIADVYMGTFSKAVGIHGAFIATCKDFADYLVNTAREYIYSTMAPAFLAYGISKSLDLIVQGQELRAKLAENIQLFKATIRPTLLANSHSQTSIQPIIIGDTSKMLALSATLKQHGILVGAIRPPTVPVGTARLRITITAAHTSADIVLLATLLNEYA